MKVEDYEYIGKLDEDIILTEQRKSELIKKIKDQVTKNGIALHKILRTGKNDVEYDFIYDWIIENDIQIRGINGTLSGEIQDYVYIKRFGASELPEKLENKEQEALFRQLNDMKKKGINTDSEEYQAIRNKIIEHNMRLAIWTVGFKFARGLKRYNIEKEDLIQIAMEGLIKAVDGYKVNYGAKFSTYAVKVIRNNVPREWNKSYSNHFELQREWERLDRFQEEMLKSIEREPTEIEVMEFLGIDRKELEKLRDYINYHTYESIEDIEYNDEEDIIRDLLDDEVIAEQERIPILDGIYIEEESIISKNETTKEPAAIKIAKTKELKDQMQSILNTLTENEKKVIELRFGLGEDGEQHTLKKIRKNNESFRRTYRTNRSKSTSQIKTSFTYY